jgi:parvulin-like peptidyl-prolyl isomerase
MALLCQFFLYAVRGFPLISRRIILNLVLILMFWSWFTSCDKTPTKDTNSLHPEEAVAQQPESKSTHNPDEKAASVNDEAITQAQVNQELDNILSPFQDKATPEQMLKLQETLRGKAIDNLIDALLILQQANKLAVQPSREDVDSRYSEFEKRFSTPAEFKDILTSMGSSELKIREDITRSLTIEKFLSSKIPGDKQITSDEIAQYYKDYPDLFANKEQARVSHILMKVEDTDTSEMKGDKQDKLRELKKRINAGEDFGVLAREFSECPSKEQDGDLGYFDREGLVKPLSDLAFMMKINEVSDVVESTFGYHLLKVTDRINAGVKPLDEVKDSIQKVLAAKRTDEAVHTYLTKLKESAEIKYF